MELGLSFQRSEELVSFLLSAGLLGEESNGGTARYITTMKGYHLLYFISRVQQDLGQFFPKRKGNRFAQPGSAQVEKELTELMFDLPSKHGLGLNRVSK